MGWGLLKGKIGTSMIYYSIYRKKDDVTYVTKGKKKKVKAPKSKVDKINEYKAKCRRCFYFNECDGICNFTKKAIPKNGIERKCKYQFNRMNTSSAEKVSTNQQLTCEENPFIVPPNKPNSKKVNCVKLGSHVKVLNLKTKSLLEIQIVSPTEANKVDYKISIESPFGKAIKGQSVGRIVTINTDNKNEVYKILTINERKENSEAMGIHKSKNNQFKNKPKKPLEKQGGQIQKNSVVKNSDNELVKLYEKVKLLNLDSKLILDIMIVQQRDEDRLKYKVSVLSPLGRAVIYQRVGSIVEVDVKGKIERYKILSVN